MTRSPTHGLHYIVLLYIFAKYFLAISSDHVIFLMMNHIGRYDVRILLDNV